MCTGCMYGMYVRDICTEMVRSIESNAQPPELFSFINSTRSTTRRTRRCRTHYNTRFRSRAAKRTPRRPARANKSFKTKTPTRHGLRATMGGPPPSVGTPWMSEVNDVDDAGRSSSGTKSQHSEGDSEEEVDETRRWLVMSPRLLRLQLRAKRRRDDWWAWAWARATGRHSNRL